MTAPPTIEPHPDNQALPGGHPPYYQAPPAPGYQPVTSGPARESWAKRNPAVILSLIGSVWLVAQLVSTQFLDSERAARQLAIDEGDRKEAKAREKSEGLMRKEIRANGRGIGTLSRHHLESSRYTWSLIRQINADPSTRLDLPPALRDAENELRDLQRRH